MKSIRRLACVQLSAITDEKGDLKAPRESFWPSGQGIPQQHSQIDGILNQPQYIPVNIYEPCEGPRTNSNLGVFERIGLLTVRMLGIDSMTLWLPFLAVIALLGVILVIMRW